MPAGVNAPRGSARRCAARRGAAREVLAVGRVHLAGMMGGDAALLKAMARNEGALVEAWQNALGNPDTPTDMMSLVETALSDATRHRDWLRHAAAD